MQVVSVNFSAQIPHEGQNAVLKIPQKNEDFPHTIKKYGIMAVTKPVFLRLINVMSDCEMLQIWVYRCVPRAPRHKTGEGRSPSLKYGGRRCRGRP